MRIARRLLKSELPSANPYPSANLYHNLGVAYFRKQQFFNDCQRVRSIQNNIIAGLLDAFNLSEKPDAGLHLKSLLSNTEDTNKQLDYEYIEKSIENFKEALTINPEHIGALYHISFIASSVGLYNLSLEELNEVVKIKPSHGDAYFALGIIHTILGNYDEEKKYFDTSQKYNHNSIPHTKQNLENLLKSDRKEYIKKLRELELERKKRSYSIQENRDSVLIYNIGQMLDVLGTEKSKNKATGCYEIAEKLNPFLSRAGFFDSISLLKRLEAKKQIKMLIEADPNEPMYDLQLAGIHKELEEYSSAIKRIREAVKKGTDIKTVHEELMLLRTLKKSEYFGETQTETGENITERILDHYCSDFRIYRIVKNNILNIITDAVRETDKSQALYPHMHDSEKWLELLIKAAEESGKKIEYTAKIALKAADGLHEIERGDNGRIKKTDYGIGVLREKWEKCYHTAYPLVKIKLPSNLAELSQEEWNALHNSDTEDERKIIRVLYDKYKGAHSERSAKIAKKILRGKVPVEMLNLISDLIAKHEVGGDELSDLVRDADSISHFNVGAEECIKTRELNLAELKIEFMYDRMSEFDKIVSTPFYIIANLNLAERYSNECSNAYVKLEEIKSKIDGAFELMDKSHNIVNKLHLKLEEETTTYIWKQYLDASEKATLMMEMFYKKFEVLEKENGSVRRITPEKVPGLKISKSIVQPDYERYKREPSQIDKSAVSFGF